jgi:hypothetical protein
VGNNPGVAGVMGRWPWELVTGSLNGTSYVFNPADGYNLDQSARETYRTNFYLRKGERLTRQWYNDGKCPFPQGMDEQNQIDHVNPRFNNGTIKDPRNYAVESTYLVNNQRVYGNAYHSYSPELAGNKYQENARSFNGLACGDTLAGEPALHPAAAGTEGSAVYEIYSIYSFAESFIEGAYYLKSAGQISLEFSLDSGTTWVSARTINATASGRQSFSVDIGKARWDAGQASTFNMRANPSSWPSWPRPSYGYRYLVRIKIRADQNIKDVGLVSLTFRNTMIHNLFLLPTLVPGQNQITLEGNGLTPDCALRCKFVWEEDGVQKTREEYAASLPHTFTIQVLEADTAKVKCRYMELETMGAGTTKVRTREKAAPRQGFNFFPNPWRGGVMTFSAGEKSSPPLIIYTPSGRLVRTIFFTGRHVVWDGRDEEGRNLPEGVYLARFSTGRSGYSQPIILLR